MEKVVDKKTWVLSLYEEHQGNFSAIARIVGLSRERVRQIYQTQGVTSKDADRFLQDKINLIIQIAQDSTAKEISKKTGLSKRTVYRIKKQFKLQFKQGSKGISKKYSDELLIETYFKCNENYYQMDKSLGLHLGACWRMMKNRGLSQEYPSKTIHKSK